MSSSATRLARRRGSGGSGSTVSAMIESGDSYSRSCVSATGPGERALDRQHAVRRPRRSTVASTTSANVAHADERRRVREEPLAAAALCAPSPPAYATDGHRQRRGMSRPHRAQYVSGGPRCARRAPAGIGWSQLQSSGSAAWRRRGRTGGGAVHAVQSKVMRERRRARRPRTRPSSRCRRGPASGVDTSAASTASSSAAATSGAPERRARSSSATERSIAAGFAIPRPAMSGAEPCTGSNTPGPAVAEARRRREPEPAGQPGGDVREDVAEHVLGHDRRRTAPGPDEQHRRVVDEHVRRARRRHTRARASSTTRRHMRDVSSTFALSTDVSRPPRPRASSKPRRAMRSTCAGWYSHVSKRVPSSRRPLRAEVEPADELADDQQIDARPARGPQVRVDVELAAQAEQPLLRPHVGGVELRIADRRLAAPRRPRGRRRASRPAAGRRSRGSRRRRRGAPRARRRAAAREHPHRGGRDLGPDPVAGEGDDLHGRIIHAATRSASSTASASASISTGLEPLADRLERLQPVAGHEQHDAIARRRPRRA